MSWGFKNERNITEAGFHLESKDGGFLDEFQQTRTSWVDSFTNYNSTFKVIGWEFTY